MAAFCLMVAGLPAIEVFGNQNGIWSPDDNPYQVIGDVTVPAGMTLQLLPGVIVEVMGNYRVTAQGTLQAQGTETDSIYFRNGQSNPNALWKGIRLENTVLTSHFSHCYIENGEFGINSINSPTIITRCHFNRNKKGIQPYGIGSAQPASVQITFCKIEFSRENGIFIAQNSNTMISYCDISNNGVASSFRAAIQLSNQSAGGSNSPTISHNHIHHNRWQGITAWDMTGTNAINPMIHNNLIEYNFTGIYLLNASGYIHNNTIRNNFIAGNMDSGAGVMVSGITSQPYFEMNVINGNYTGFYITNNARPCLGDLSIYHTWAQGENIIRNNVDALGELHSIYCAQYPNNTTIIKAENNWWDFDDEAGIRSTLNDSHVNPALPTVDFIPFLIDQDPGIISGTVHYDNSMPVADPRLQIVSQANGQILAEYDIVLNSPLSLGIDVPDAVYIVAKAAVSGGNRFLYGALGGIDDPLAVSIAPGETLDISVELTHQTPWRYEWIKESVTEGGIHYHRVHFGFFVYGGDYINWLSRNGDNILFLKHTRPDTPADHTWLLPSDNVWLKVADLEDGNWWNRLEITDAAGTIMTSRFTYRRANGQIPNGNDIQHLEGHLLWQRDFGGNFISQEVWLQNGETINRRYFYQNNLVSSAYERMAQGIQPDNTIYPLVTQNLWRHYPLALEPRPTDLVYRLDTTDPLITGVALMWQAPALGSGNWTAYHVYANDILIGTTPLSQPWFYHDDAPVGSIPVLEYRVCAFDSVVESEPSNTITFFANDSVSDVSPAARISIFPNPFRLGGGQLLTIKAAYPQSSNVEIGIYNLRGQLIRRQTFMHQKQINFGWDGKDDNGSLCGSGIYFVRISPDGALVQIKRFMLIR